MPDPVDKLVRADAEAAAAKARLRATLDRLQERLEPRRLAKTAAREIADGATAAAHAASTTAKRRAGPLTGIVAVAGLFLARHRIAALLKRKRQATGADADR